MEITHNYSNKYHILGIDSYQINIQFYTNKTQKNVEYSINRRYNRKFFADFVDWCSWMYYIYSIG